MTAQTTFRRIVVATIALPLLALLPVACDMTGSRSNSSYDDGYADAYSITCGSERIGGHADWSDSNYSEGYREGHKQASLDCMAAARALDFPR